MRDRSPIVNEHAGPCVCVFGSALERVSTRTGGTKTAGRRGVCNTTRAEQPQPLHFTSHYTTTVSKCIVRQRRSERPLSYLQLDNSPGVCS